MQGLYGSLSFGAGGLVGGLLSGQTWGILGGGMTYTLAALFAAVGGLLLWRWLPVARVPIQPIPSAAAR